jgi:hypothetical protein
MPVLPRPAQFCKLLVVLITQSPVVDRKGLAPLMEPMALRLKRPNRSLLREPIHERGAASGSRAPFPSLATKYFTVKPMLHVLHAHSGFVLAGHTCGDGPDGYRPTVSGQPTVVKMVAYAGAAPAPAP